VASAAVGGEGRVVGVDTATVDPLPEPQVRCLQADLAEPDLGPRILAELGGRADLVLSDAAPKLTGVRDRDRALEEELLLAIERLVPELLRPGGDLLVKILESPEARAVERRLGALFEQAKATRPAASRSGSSERYLLAQRLRGAGPAPSR
jgi:23S rRNA (uridine2552-2'-O)-methyltransferase